MQTTKADILAQLQREILPLQGYKPARLNHIDVGLGTINQAFPNARFPLGAVHEFLCACEEDASASSGFLAGILSSLMHCNGSVFWISSSRLLFPPSLKSFGIDPGKIIFVDLRKEKEVLWAMEETLKCSGLAAVIGEMKDISFTASRRLQLAVEESGVTGFILRRGFRSTVTACVTRWKVSALHSDTDDGLPGLGYSRWKVELLKVRNGKPGNWQVEWAEGRFRYVYKQLPSILKVQQKKAG